MRNVKYLYSQDGCGQRWLRLKVNATLLYSPRELRRSTINMLLDCIGDEVVSTGLSDDQEKVLPRGKELYQLYDSIYYSLPVNLDDPLEILHRSTKGRQERGKVSGKISVVKDNSEHRSRIIEYERE